MKAWKLITYFAVAVFLIDLALTLSLPFRFPGDDIAWDIVIPITLSLGALSALLVLGPKLPPLAAPRVFLECAVGSLLLALVGWLPWFFAYLFLFALFALYVAFSQLKPFPSPSPE